MKTITMNQLTAALNAAFPERVEVLSCMATAYLAKEHSLLIGPPGTAKSLVARTFAACVGGSYFETLLHAFSTPEETFGPIALSGLQKDQYIRATEGYAPKAQTVFLDEVFKCNMGMLNSLLTFLNERIYHNDGKPQACDLGTCIGASNELQEGPQLDALYDRFMLRVVVPYISDREAFKRMLTAGPIVLPGTVDLATEQASTAAVSVTSDTIDALTTLRYAYSGAGFIASDRRWRQSIGLLKANAHLAERTATEPEDLEILEHVLWKKPDERVQVSKLVQGVISPDGAKAVAELDNARDLFRRIPEVGKVDAGAYMGAIGSTVQDLSSIVKRLEAMPKSRKVTSALAEVQSLKGQAGKLAMKAAGVEM